MPGYIPDGAWPQWQTFAAIAVREVDWRRVNQPAWREARQSDWSPDFVAELDGKQYLLLQNFYHGFPDPPEWTVYVVDEPAGTARCLGSLDYLPVSWRGISN